MTKRQIIYAQIKAKFFPHGVKMEIKHRLQDIFRPLIVYLFCRKRGHDIVDVLGICRRCGDIFYKCPLCDMMISTNGMAKRSHLKKHERERLIVFNVDGTFIYTNRGKSIAERSQ